jgi:hypothetical protein
LLRYDRGYLKRAVPFLRSFGTLQRSRGVSDRRALRSAGDERLDEIMLFGFPYTPESAGELFDMFTGFDTDCIASGCAASSCSTRWRALVKRVIASESFARGVSGSPAMAVAACCTISIYRPT